MNILVTGGAGYIGSHTVYQLGEAGHRVTVVDDLSTGFREAVPDDILHVQDFGDRQTVANLLRHHRIDCVIHFAAATDVAQSMNNPFIHYQNNVLHFVGLLEAMRTENVQNIVFSSSASVYGTPDQCPVNESTPTHPESPYGRTKLIGEGLLADYAQAYGFACISLRYFNAAGADWGNGLGDHRRPASHLIPIILETALGQRDRFVIHGDDYPTPDGTCIRDFVHVEDLARAHVDAISALQTSQHKIYNLGSTEGYSVRQVYESCCRVTDRLIPCEVGPRRPGDLITIRADISRAQRELDWHPDHKDIDEIVSSTWQWMSQRAESKSAS